MKAHKPPKSGPWTPPKPIYRTTQPADARFSIPGATPTRKKPIAKGERDVYDEDTMIGRILASLPPIASKPRSRNW
jgi:hypothetical protein